MREFFHGWRRKVGVVTLLMALAATTLWVRSVYLHDWVLLLDDEVSVESVGGRIIVMHGRPHNVVGELLNWGSKTNEIDAAHTSYFMASRHRFVVPHWPIAIPLTLISAYLILWKPRKRT